MTSYYLHKIYLTDNIVKYLYWTISTLFVLLLFSNIYVIKTIYSKINDNVFRARNF